MLAVCVDDEKLILDRNISLVDKLDEIDARVGLSSDPAYSGFKSTTNTLRSKLPPPQT